MITSNFQERVCRVNGRIMDLLLHDIFCNQHAEDVRLGLPAGAVQLGEPRLILAATVCDPPLFREAVATAAATAGSDVILAHTGFFPETLNDVHFSLSVHIDGKPHQFERMVLFYQPSDGYWLVPLDRGPFVALERGGLRVHHEPPFLTAQQRATGVCEAAKILVRRTRSTAASR